MKPNQACRAKLCPAKPKNIRLSTTLLLLSLSLPAHAQEPAGTERYTISGRVLSAEDNLPLPGATVQLKGGRMGVNTDENGAFTLTAANSKVMITVSYLGYRALDTALLLPLEDSLVIKLKQDANVLDETVVIGYGTTSKRFNTGSVTRISSKDIGNQPVPNPLEALVARVPGVITTQSNGNPGAGFNVTIRGLNSISQGSQPLFLIDGIPFPNEVIGSSYAGISMANGGQSPFASINPGDIESIEILKDADATAIYGSRGANGVILISTKSGREGKTTLDLNFNRGVGQVPGRLKLMNTAQYRSMRMQAYANDGIEPTAVPGTAGYAPDLTVWDSTKYTDWQEYFIGGTANYMNLTVSLSGGNAGTRFLIGGNYHRQTSVYPGDFGDDRAGLNVSLTQKALNDNLTVRLKSGYNNDKNELFAADLTPYIALAPNYPDLLDNGELHWWEEGAGNPLSYLFQKSQAVTDNLITNLNVTYSIAPGLQLEANSGYTFTAVANKKLEPRRSFNPLSDPIGASFFSNSSIRNWIVEPQIRYRRSWRNNKLELLGGYTIQNNVTRQDYIAAEGFRNDAVIESPSFASTVRSQRSLSDYRYQALYGRFNCIHKQRYLLNITGRRDGSSRFGPGKRWANFGALGAGWIFSEESWMRPIQPVLSFGKIRASYGITGNDQIGDYQYLDDYSSYLVYQGVTTYYPARLYNPDYAWETNRKFELGLELGFSGDRLFADVNYFSNRSSNQLVNYKLPDQTGFPTILKNFEALVENSGFEVSVSGKIKERENFGWFTDFNFTVSGNKLVSFPDIESSAYATTYVVGKPLNIRKLYVSRGVDRERGIYELDGTDIKDRNFVFDLNPAFYGGWSNRFVFRGFELSILFQYVKQEGINAVYAPFLPAPGTLSNQPADILGRTWVKEGEPAGLQRYTASSGDYLTAFNNYKNSSAIITDASFIRLKNLGLYYNLPAKVLNHIHANTLKLYVQGQNLFTLSEYKGLEPENQGLSAGLPLLRVIVAGIQITF